MELIKSLLGIKQLEERILNLEKEINKNKNIKEHKLESEDKIKILLILKEPMTTMEIAKKLNKGRSWTSELLNRLERERKVKEIKKKGKTILYGKTK